MEFELSGGALCLDFANTTGNHARPEQEHLHRYADLVAFARQTGIVAPGEATELARRARADEAGASTAFAAVRELREAIYRVFSAIAAGDRPPSSDLERLNAALPDALAGLRVEPQGEAFAWTRTDAADSLTAPLRPVVRSAADLLTAPQALSRVRECDGESCTWLFLDQSRNRSRRWCSMESCGNRAKVRRHYRRRRDGEG